jgi:muramidase (phage lysozyme)
MGMKLMAIALSTCGLAIVGLSACGERRLPDVISLIKQSPATLVSDSSLTLTDQQLGELVVTRAFLKTIMLAEGTYPNAYGWSPYRVGVGYRYLPSFEDHPTLLDDSGYNPEANSDASGAYQAMSFTWEAAWKNFPEAFDHTQPRFSPKNQDIFAVIKMSDRGAYWTLVEGIAIAPDGSASVSRESFDRAVFKLCQEWASFPCDASTTSSYYEGQSAHSIEDLWLAFQQALEAENDRLKGLRQ